MVGVVGVGGGGAGVLGGGADVSTVELLLDMLKGPKINLLRGVLGATGAKRW